MTQEVFEGNSLFHRVGILLRAAAAPFVMLILFLIWAALGLVAVDNILLILFTIVAFSAMIALLILKPKIYPLIESKLIVIKPLMFAGFIIMGFYMLESPYGNPFSLSPYYMGINLCLIIGAFVILYFLGQRKKPLIVAFLVICFVIGLANYFLMTFKGQPILPSDLLALKTAASVSAGYVYAIDQSVVLSYIVLGLGITLTYFLPKAELHGSRVLVNSTIALSIVLAFGVWFADEDIESAYGIHVDAWNVQQSYAQNGSALCFLKRTQDLTPKPPASYSAETADEVLQPYGSTEDEFVAFDDTEKPSIVAIMNETFADLSLFDTVGHSYSRSSDFSAMRGTITSGNAYVSALGGGTCNSEFEFLTGASIGNLGGGVYPYMLYDFSTADNIAGHLKSLGYGTTAIHPAEAGNWRRNQVYAQLGFDEFYDIESYRDVETLRGLVTDRATYDTVLDVLENTDEPQFIFDVTIQNHGGYLDNPGTEPFPEEMKVSIDLDIDPDDLSELNTYLGLIEQSEKDLRYLLRRLETLDEKVVLCFFGDHQPELVDLISTLEYGKNFDEFTLQEIQARYTVPYVIWANYEVDEPTRTSILSSLMQSDDVAEHTGLVGGIQNIWEEGVLPLWNGTSDAPDTDSSLNYLSAMTLAAAGIPLSPYQDLVLDTQTYAPAMNLNGYLSAEGVWHWYDQESSSTLALRRYEIAQYEMMFTHE